MHKELVIACILSLSLKESGLEMDDGAACLIQAKDAHEAGRPAAPVDDF